MSQSKTRWAGRTALCTSSSSSIRRRCAASASGSPTTGDRIRGRRPCAAEATRVPARYLGREADVQENAPHDRRILDGRDEAQAGAADAGEDVDLSEHPPHEVGPRPPPPRGLRGHRRGSGGGDADSGDTALATAASRCRARAPGIPWQMSKLTRSFGISTASGSRTFDPVPADAVLGRAAVVWLACAAVRRRLALRSALDPVG